VVKRIKKYRGVYKESNKRNGEKQRRWIKKRRKDNSGENKHMFQIQLFFKNR